MQTTSKKSKKQEYLTRAQKDSLIKAHQSYMKKMKYLIEKTSGYSNTYLRQAASDLCKVWNDLSFVI